LKLKSWYWSSLISLVRVCAPSEGRLRRLRETHTIPP
jgi:hypothetical protein